MQAIVESLGGKYPIYAVFAVIGLIVVISLVLKLRDWRKRDRETQEDALSSRK
jgi:hypothetical protein